MSTPTAEDLKSPPPARRYDGKKVALAFGIFLLVGTVVVTTMGYFGRMVGAETRERYDAARAAED